MLHSNLTAFALIAPLLSAAPQTAADPKADAVAKDLDALKGAWQMTSRINDGRETPAAQVKNRVMTFDAEKCVVRNGNKVIWEATYTIDPTTEPKSLDLTTPSAGPDKGKSRLAVYKLDGDSLTICFGAYRDVRPTDFTCKPVSNRLLITYQRAK